MQPAQLLALSSSPPLPNSQELGSRLNPMESCPIAPIVMFLGVCGGRSQDEGLCGDHYLTTGLRRLGNACAPAPKTMAENDTQAAIAQLAARRSHNPKVVSLILTGRTLLSSPETQNSAAPQRMSPRASSIKGQPGFEPGTC